MGADSVGCKGGLRGGRVKATRAGRHMRRRHRGTVSSEVIVRQGQPTQDRDIRWRGQPTQDRVRGMAGRRGQPTQAHARDEAGRGGEPARADEVDAKIVWIRQGGGTRYILFNRRKGQAGEERGVSVLLSSSI